MPVHPGIPFSLLLMLAPMTGQAEQHALLIGVSEYSEPRIPDLEGAINDVDALRNVLVSNWQFSDDNVAVLANEGATEVAILDALDALMETTSAGDDIIIYFSGHGTSALDPDLGSHLNFPDGSGAIVASDFNPGKINRNSLTHPTNDGLLVGRFEIRPRLEHLDKDRNVLVIFDACFSGNATREFSSVYKPSAKRHIDLSSFIDKSDPPDFMSGSAIQGSGSRSVAAQPANEFHYTNTVYFGAAAEYEYAVDISAAEIAAGLVDTIDGKPHGGFTDSLLRALWDKPTQSLTLSYANLFSRTLNQFNIYCKACGHTPVSLPVANAPDHELLGRTILKASANWQNFPGYDGSKEPALDKPIVIDGGILTESELALKGPLATFRRTPAIIDTETSPDIYFEKSVGHLKAFASDGALITELPKDFSADAMALWLLGRQWLKDRMAHDVKNEQGNLYVTFRHALAGNRVSEGENINFDVLSTHDAKLVVLVLDAYSNLSVLYPVNARERKAVLLALTAKSVPDEGEPLLKVTPPWGTDTVLFYALNPTHALDPLLSELASLDSIPFDHPQWIAFEAALDRSDFDYSSALVRVISMPSP